ncbi:beta-galactosidase 1-like isoform X2 [Musa acuminata AAA Group]
MQNFTTLIVDMVKQAGLFATQGGPIILAQIENEFGNVETSYGDAGPRYVNLCSQMADSLSIDVPWIMCQQADAPQPMINTCNGFSGCDAFTPNDENSPKILTENWTGWFKNWGSPDPHRPAEELAFQVARFFQTKGTLQNYYMYHGGTNFGRTSGGPYIVTSYDYDAPLDEYGYTRQPKWGHLKELHASIKLMEKALTYGEVEEVNLDNELTITKYSGDGVNPACFLSNQNSKLNATIDYEGSTYFLPAWSVSILPDCKSEVYNTAKVKTQTSLMVKKRNTAMEASEVLYWSWRPERLGISAKGFGSTFTVNNLLEQKSVTLDESDYLWYTTSVDVGEKEEFTLSVNTTGHILHAFVNDRLVGSQYGLAGQLNFTFERKVWFNPGRNVISLLSATVGLQIGLDGEVRRIHLDRRAVKWHSGMFPTNRPFTWYKATFQAPLGSEAVVVDLLGMGKGTAWVNGNSIGRFWPNYTASADGCHECDYRGTFSSNKCQTGCGEPSQRWYHVPRSFLKLGEPNTLMLFEEAGGNPLQVNFQTVTVGAACASASEGDTLSLSCLRGRTISRVDFASFEEPEGTCGAFEGGRGCSSDEAFAVIKDSCLGTESCSIEITEEFGKSCGTLPSPRKLVVQVTC